MKYYEKNEMLCRTKLEMKKFAEKKMMEEKYEDAAYYFGKAGEASLQSKAIIYLNYKKIIEDKRNHKLNDYEFKELNQEIIDKINELKSEPDIFQDSDNIEAFCYLNLEEYDTALELYKDKKMYNEVGKIYFEKKHDYEEAFEYFKQANKISNAIKSCVKSDKKGHFLRLFEYINNSLICFKLGLSEFYNVYEKYINDLFVSILTKKRYIRNIFNIAKKEEGEKENQREKKEEKETETEEEKENELNNKEKKNINIKIFENNINNESEKEINIKDKRKKKSGKRRRLYTKNRNNNRNEDDDKNEDEDKNKKEEEINEDDENDDYEENNKSNENDENNKGDENWKNTENNKDNINIEKKERNEENENKENLENNENEENKEKNGDDKYWENKEIKEDEKIDNDIQGEESLKNIGIEEELNKTQKLNFIIYEVVDIIKGRVNDYIFNSIYSSLSIEEKGKYLVDYVFEKVLKKYQKLIVQESLEEEENLEIEELNSKVKELKEKKIELNIKNNISKENCFEFNSIDEQKLIEIKNTNIFKNNQKSKTHKEIIENIIEKYYSNLNMLEKKKEYEKGNKFFDYEYFLLHLNEYQIKLSNNHINQFKEEFKLSSKINDFIECYYFNTKNYAIKEIIKCMPELYYYKSYEFKNSSNNVKDLLVKVKETNDKIYENIINIIASLFLLKLENFYLKLNNLLLLIILED